MARLESGHTPSRKHADYWDGGVPWIGIKDATHNHGRVLDDTYQHASALGIENSSARVLPARTVCLSRTASVGYVVVMGQPMATSQDFVNWVCSEGLDWRFLKHVLLAERDALGRYAHGTTHQTIYFPEVKAFHVALPPIDEQRAIASVLGALDDKIESNRWLASTARALSATVYDQAVSRDGITESMSDIVDFHNRERIPLSAAQRAERAGDIPYYGATGVFGYVDNYLFNEPLLLVGEDGTVMNTDGTPIVQYIWGKAWVNNHAHVITGTKVTTETAVLAVERADVRPLVTGAVQAKISMRNLKALKVEVPSESTLGPTEAVVRPLFEQVRAHLDESRTLTAIRDALLPKLVSGKIRVPITDDPEEQVGAAVEALSA